MMPQIKTNVIDCIFREESNLFNFKSKLKMMKRKNWNFKKS